VSFCHAVPVHIEPGGLNSQRLIAGLRGRASFGSQSVAGLHLPLLRPYLCENDVDENDAIARY
jgi:hypothetical protein